MIDFSTSSFARIGDCVETPSTKMFIASLA